MEDKQKEFEVQEEFETVTLTLDDDKEIECQILTVFTVEEQDYIALMPLEEFDGEEGIIFLYRYFDDEEEPRLEVIESDEEYDKAADAFDAAMDELDDDTIDLDEE